MSSNIPPRYEKPPKIPQVKNKNPGILAYVVALGTLTALLGGIIWLNIEIWSSIF